MPRQIATHPIPPFAKGGLGGIFTAVKLEPPLKSPPTPLLQRGELVRRIFNGLGKEGAC